MVPLRWGDATSVTLQLNQIFARVIVGPTGSPTILQARPGQGGFPGQGQGFPGQGQGGQQGGQQGGPGQGNQQNAQAASMVLIRSRGRTPSLVAAPRSRMPQIIKEIQKLDGPQNRLGLEQFPSRMRRPSLWPRSSTTSTRTVIRPRGMRRARFAPSSMKATTTVFVQAAPADMAEIQLLIMRIDTTYSGAVLELRVVKLNYALSDDLVAGRHAGGEPGCVAPRIKRQRGRRLRRRSWAGGGLGGGGGGLGAGGAGGLGAAGAQVQIPNQTRPIMLNFVSKDAKAVQAGILDDIRITSYPSLIRWSSPRRRVPWN